MLSLSLRIDVWVIGSLTHASDVIIYKFININGTFFAETSLQVSNLTFLVPILLFKPFKLITEPSSLFRKFFNYGFFAFKSLFDCTCEHNFNIF